MYILQASLLELDMPILLEFSDLPSLRICFQIFSPFKKLAMLDSCPLNDLILILSLLQKSCLQRKLHLEMLGFGTFRY